MNKFSLIILASLLLGLSTAYADIEFVSVSSSGEQGNDYSGSAGDVHQSMSADGRFVAFNSDASNLVPGDTNGITDVFVHDRATGVTERVSVSSNGEQGVTLKRNPRGSRDPEISADGRFVVFQSDAGNLVPNDINGEFSDIFMHDRQTGITEVVSFYTNGEQLTYSSFTPSISADGRFVAYVAGRDLFVHDLVTSMVSRENESSSGVRGNVSTGEVDISADGRIIAFGSNSTNLVDGITTNGRGQIFVRDRLSGITELVSKSQNGELGNKSSDFPSISADGRYVAFESDSSNLVPGDFTTGNINTERDVFIHDRQTGGMERVSVLLTGQPAGYRGSGSFNPSISADGRYVVFQSSSTYDVPNGNRAEGGLYMHDRQSGLTELALDPQNGASPSISADGRYFVFQAFASFLFPGNQSLYQDIFVANNPLSITADDLVVVEKLINNETRETQNTAAKLATGTLYRQSYKVTNDSPNRIYQVKVFENGNLVCNFFALNPGQTRQRCDMFKTVQTGEQHVQVDVSAKVSGSGDVLSGSTDAYYTGLNVNGELRVTHRINNVNADSPDQAQTLGSSQASVSYKVENTGEIELYQVKAYHDPVSPVNSGWNLQCVLGPMKSGQVRYCKRDINLNDTGLNQTMGRVQGRNAIRSATDVVNASNPTYFIVP